MNAENQRAESRPAATQQRGLVSGRECGACTVCCRVLPVNTDGLKKTANVLCVHCEEGRGCRIYQKRPGVCRSFYCDWRLNPHVPATWRPDRAGIFIERVAPEHIEHIPEGYTADYAIVVMLLRPDAIERPALAATIAHYTLRRVPTFLSIPGPPGYLPAHIFINEAVEGAAGKRDPDAMMRVLRQAHETIMRDKFDPVPDLG